MKNIITILLLLITFSCKSQIYPLRTYTDVPDNSYLKDTNNELNDYIGTWKATWNNKTIFIYISKEINKYKLYTYMDYLIIKFKVTDVTGTVLFDNTNLPNDDVKIVGGNFKELANKYFLSYVDPDLCMRSGIIVINFTDSSKTQIKWVFSESENWIDQNCFYYGTPLAQRPEAIPQNAIFIKQ